LGASKDDVELTVVRDVVELGILDAGGRGGSRAVDRSPGLGTARGALGISPLVDPAVTGAQQHPAETKDQGARVRVRVGGIAVTGWHYRARVFRGPGGRNRGPGVGGVVAASNITRIGAAPRVATE